MIRIMHSRPCRPPAEFLAAKGNIDGAIQQYRQALEIDPNSVEALAKLANALVSKGQLDEVTNHFALSLGAAIGSEQPGAAFFDLSVGADGDSKVKPGNRKRKPNARRRNASRPGDQ